MVSSISLPQQTDGTISVQGVLLGTLAAAGLVATALLAPNALQLLRYARPQRYRYPSQVRAVDHSLAQLVRRGFIEQVRSRGHTHYQLTPKGEARLAQIQLSFLEQTRPKKWDGKWRIVTYDICEERRTKRALLLRALKEAGFYHLQDSVWVYPYPCRELHLLLKFHFALGREVLFVEGAEIELEPKLLNYFGLQR